MDQEQHEQQVDELLKEIRKLKKSKQKFQDNLRILRKEMREGYREENALEEYEREIKYLLNKNGEALNNFTIKKHEKVAHKVYGILQLSDLHLNELVSKGDAANEYDFLVAAKRLKKFVNRAKQYFRAFGVNRVLIAATGDLLNSDRRKMDELLNQATGRAAASVLSVHLLKQVILDVAEEFPTSVTAVVGNESRCDEEMGFSHNGLVANNYDYSIFQMLKMLFQDKKEIRFLEPKNWIESVVRIGELKFLLTHGLQLSASAYSKSVAQLVAKHASQGRIIDYTISGHIHETLITDNASRSASLAGANGYSNNSKLNVSGKASQNIFIVQGKSIDRIAIDLQDAAGYGGYDIIEELEKYSAKSVSGKKV